MAFKRGHKLSPGRKKGSKNKRTDLFALCEELGVDVMREMITLASEEPDKELRFSKLRDIAPYLYARKKEVLNLADQPVEELLKAAEEKIKDDPTSET